MQARQSGLRVPLGISFTAKVYCVHDVEKRKRIDLEFDASKHKVQLCACCENLFLTRTDEPSFCALCSRPASHAVRAPLPRPNEVLHG